MERPFPAYSGPDPYIFVSYAHDDAATVYPELQRIREAGFNVWYDEGIRPGSTWRDEVALALTQCSLFLFFVTPRSVESKNCQQELNFCLSRERAILCAHLEDTPLSPGMELSLSDKQAIIRHHYDEHGFGQKLLSSLAETIPKPIEPISLLKQEPVAEANPDQRSIAVLALENRSSDPENEYLSDGISEAIIGGLSKIDGLRVASEIASFALKGQNLDLKSMGQALGVETLLSGSVRKAGDRVRVSVHLAQVSDGSTLWSERYEGTIEQIFELEDEVVRRVIDALKIEFASKPPRDEPVARTRNAEAYNLFLMGNFESRKQSVQGWRKAAELLQKSIALDPEYFDAYASLINTLSWLVAQEGDPDDRRQALTRSCCDEMERLDPQKSNPRWSLIERNLLFQQAPRSDIAKTFLGSPTFDAVAHANRYHDNYVAGQYGSLAEMCRAMGLYRSQLELQERASAMGYEQLYGTSQGWAALGHFDRAIEVLDAELKIDPQAAASRSDRCIYLCRTGQYERAREDLDALNAIWGPRHFPAFCFHYWRDDLDEARNCHEWLLTRRRYDPYYKGVQTIMLGELDLGIEYFWEGQQAQSAVISIIHALNDSYLRPSQLDAVKAHPRYQELLKAIGVHRDDQDEFISRINSIMEHTGVKVKRDSEHLA